MHGMCFSFKVWKVVLLVRGRRELSKPRFGALRTFRTKRSDNSRKSVTHISFLSKKNNSGMISLIRIFQAGSLLGFNFHTILLRLCKWRFCKSSTQSRCGTATYAKPADLRIDFLSLVKVFSVCRKLTRGMKNGSI